MIGFVQLLEICVPLSNLKEVLFVSCPNMELPYLLYWPTSNRIRAWAARRLVRHLSIYKICN